MVAIGLREEDIGESYFKTVKSGGKAGLIGVMLHHPASGLRIRCNRERSQGINRFLARRMLVEGLERKARRTAPTPSTPQPAPARLHPPQTLFLPKPPPHWGYPGTESPDPTKTPEP